MSHVRRLIPLFLVLCLVLLPLTSCAGKTVLSYGTQSLSSRLFSYALTLTKTQMLATLSGTTSDLTDDPAIWTTELGDGSTYADAVLKSTLDTVKMTLFYANYAKENSITLTDEEKTSARENVETIVSSFESRKDFDSYMSSYGFDYDLLLSYYELDALSTAGMRAYYQHPATSLTQADVKAYYESEYATCLFLYVNETDMTLSNGKTVPLSETQKAERTAYFDSALAAVEGGAKLEDFLSKSDDSSFEEGEAKTFQLSALSPAALAEALSEMEEGEVRTLSADKGRYLVRKDALSDAFYEENSDALLLTVVQKREKVILEEKADSFSFNEDYFSSLDIANLPIF